jgi:hypothetical protein
MDEAKLFAHWTGPRFSWPELAEKMSSERTDRIERALYDARRKRMGIIVRLPDGESARFDMVYFDAYWSASGGTVQAWTCPSGQIEHWLTMRGVTDYPEEQDCSRVAEQIDGAMYEAHAYHGALFAYDDDGEPVRAVATWEVTTK